MLKKSTVFLCLLFAVLVCPLQSAHAEEAPASIKAPLLQAALLSAGIESEMLLSSDDAFSRSLCIPQMKGSSVTIGFPAAGLLQGKPFLLEIDDMTALVSYTRDRKLAVIAGDSRMEAMEAFSSTSCILTAVFDMVEEILENVFHLNVLGIISAVFNGVVNIINC